MNKPLLILMLFLFFDLGNAISQDLSFNGPVGLALANVRTLDGSPWAVYNNAASLADVEDIVCAASYQIRFNLDELSARSLCAIWPNKYGIVSAGVLQNGFSKSLLSRYMLGYSRGFGKSTSAFLQYNFITHNIEGSGSAKGFYSALGLRQTVTKELMLGVLIVNPEQSDITYYSMSYALPTLFVAGLQWTNNAWVRVLAETEKELDRVPVYKGAVEMAVNKQFFLRCGIKGRPVEFSFGSGYSFSHFNIDIGFLYHQQLGLSSGLGIIYTFKRAEK